MIYHTIFSGEGRRQRAPSAKHQTDLTESLEEAVGGVGGETEGWGREAEDHRTQKSKGPAHGLLVRRIYAMLQVIYSVKTFRLWKTFETLSIGLTSVFHVMYLFNRVDFVASNIRYDTEWIKCLSADQDQSPSKCLESALCEITNKTTNSISQILWATILLDISICFATVVMRRLNFQSYP
jgi:hypothetical protein